MPEPTLYDLTIRQVTVNNVAYTGGGRLTAIGVRRVLASLPPEVRGAAAIVQVAPDG